MEQKLRIYYTLNMILLRPAGAGDAHTRDLGQHKTITGAA